MIDHTHGALLGRYKRAKMLFEGAFDINKLALNTTLVPYWLGDDCFWYRRNTWQGSEFRLVQANAGSNQPAFDHQALASALADLVGQPIEADNLPITKVVISLSPRVIRFQAFDKHFRFENELYQCTSIRPTTSSEEISEDSPYLSTDMFVMPNKPLSDEKFTSPDGKKAVFVRDYNLWLEDLESDESRALTHDGEALFAYAATPITFGYAPNAEIQALWSPDSKRLLTVQTDNRQVKTMPIVHHVPSDGSLRPKLTTNPYALPGDEQVENIRLVSIEVDQRKIQAANYQRIPIQFHTGHGLFIGKQAWWATNSRFAYFIDTDRYAQNTKVVEFDTYTGVTRCLFEEFSKTHIKLSSYAVRANIVALPESHELIWYSERSGWAHLYLYDLNTGALKHPITQGEWLVREILHFDAEQRELWIQTAGRVADRDPYYLDICRVDIDTGDLTTMIASDDEYSVLAPGTMAHYMIRYYDPDKFIKANALSPNARYLVTTRSRADRVPVSLLLDRNGKTILELETADISPLPNGWQWPEPVKMLAADGKTAIYGAVFRPSNFSSDQCYPVIDFSPYSPDFSCAPKGAFRNNVDGGFFYPQAAALAELGFIVVAIDGRGSPGREKAFTDASYGSLASSNFTEDRIAGVQQLAVQYPYMDLNRVGILSANSSGSELFLFPEFYKVGVCHGIVDMRLLSTLYADRYEGEDSAKIFKKPVELLVKRLQGKLLLIHDLQTSIGVPAGTLRIAEALQKANKDFDLLLFPAGLPTRYIFRRTLDYFVAHLQGIKPPKEFSFESDKKECNATKNNEEDI